MEQHTTKHDWLSLISVSGLLISEPVLESEFPDGLKSLLEWKYMRFKKERLRFEINYENDSVSAHRNWLDFIFEDLLEIDSNKWKKHNDVPKELEVDLSEFSQTLKPNRVLMNENNNPILIVITYPLEQSIDRQENKTGRWKASPFVKLDRLLRETEIPLGIVTNGEEFRLVYAAPGLSTSYLTWTAQGWIDEKITIESFINLLNNDRIFGKNIRKIIELIEESQKRQVDVANQLGMQVRDAIEIFIKAMDKADKKRGGLLLSNIHGDELYHTTLTVMMRLVFLLYAEENYLLPHGQMMYDKSYGITNLLVKLQQSERKSEQNLDENSDAWNRLLSTFRLVHGGSSHPDLLLNGYGGELFDPIKFTILEHPDFIISNRDIFKILRNLTFAQSKLGKTTIAQRLSYRTLDVEQIGSIYENLIDYTVKRAEEDLIVLKSSELNIIQITELQNLSENKIVEFLSQLTKKPKEKIETLLKNNLEKINVDEKISDLIETRIKSGDLYLTQKKGERKGSGSFYTPKEVTNFLVKKVLENLAYDKVDSKLKIKSPRDILDLNICDPAMGSGAFLVQACRYLAECLMESWDKLSAENPDTVLTAPFGEPFKGKLHEELMPVDREESLILAKRLVAERCLHGVDLNPLAVELAKMSMWLTTLAKDKPFSFLDHHFKNGNSLIGCTTELIEKYPSDALNRSTFTNDEKEILSELKKIITKQSGLINKGQSFLFQPTVIVKQVEQKVISKLEEIDKISVFEPNKKEEIFSKFYQSSEFGGMKKMFDGWTSIWFWPLNKESRKNIPLTDSYYDFLNHLNSSDPKIHSKYQVWNEIVTNLSITHAFFHWQLEFPDVFFKENPGFDAVIGNPPWDKIKFEEPTFFDGYYTNYHKLNSNEKKQSREKLLEKENILQIFKEQKEFASCFSNIIDSKIEFKNQSAKVYGKTKFGDKNLYKLFLEKFYVLTREHGSFGLVLPAGLTVDEGGTGLRRMLLEKTTPTGVWTFFRRSYVFPIEQPIGIFSFKKTIENDSKFTCINNIGFDSPKNIPAIMAELETKSKTFPKINSVLIKKLSKELFMFQSIPDVTELEILEVMFKHPQLREVLPNTWNVETTRELDTTNDAKWFRTIPTPIPLWKGKNIHRFKITSLPEIWVDPQCAKLKTDDHEKSRLGWNLIRDVTDIRRLTFTIIPPGGAMTTSICYFKPTSDTTLPLYLCGVLNSLVCEYRARQMAMGPSVPQFIIRELPVPRLSKDNKIRIEIEKRTLKLVGENFKTNPMPEYFSDVNYEEDETRRLKTEAEIEALVSIAYGFKKTLYEILVDSIGLPRGAVIKQKERQKRLAAIEMYDEMIKELELDVIKK